jgi:hypothetical protein
MRVDSIVRAGACALALFGCSNSKHPDTVAGPDGGVVGATEQPDAGSTPVATSTPPDAGTPAGTPDAGPTLGPPVRIDRWTYYGEEQGLSKDVRDASPDEGGNVYVAGGDAVYAKRRADEQFLRFDSENAGLSKKCNDFAYIMTPEPPTPFVQCAVTAVAGAAPGKAFVGFDGFGLEADAGVDWALETGGMDVVAFDAAQGKLSRTRHVLTAAPPHVVCDYGHVQWVDTCVPPVGTTPLPSLPWWDFGRRLLRHIDRIAVNHDPSTLMYGDAWVGGNHATMAVLLNNTARRNWKDTTLGITPQWKADMFADTKDFWEHLHPALSFPTLPFGELTQFLGEGYAVSIDPRNGMPWATNGVRTTSVFGYGVDLTGRQWDMTQQLDFWPDDTFLGADPVGGPTNDNIRALSHCADGTLWAGSLTHGLVRIDPSATRTYLHLPDDTAGVQSLACDWSDGSLWIGLARGGLLRGTGDGPFSPVVVSGAPDFAGHPIQNIQVDRWAAPRILYFAYGASKDAQGLITAAGGVAAYNGP